MRPNTVTVVGPTGKSPIPDKVGEEGGQDGEWKRSPARLLVSGGKGVCAGHVSSVTPADRAANVLQRTDRPQKFARRVGFQTLVSFCRCAVHDRDHISCTHGGPLHNAQLSHRLLLWHCAHAANCD